MYWQTLDLSSKKLPLIYDGENIFFYEFFLISSEES